MKTNCEWIQAVVRHQSGEAVPYNLMCSPPALRAAEEHYGRPLDDAINLPLRMNGCKSIKPLYANPDEFGDRAKDEFGVVWTTSHIDRGAPIIHPLKDATLDGYTFPDTRAAYRFEHLDAWCRQQKGHFRILWVGDLWERATFMRGMQELLLDVALNPTFVEELLDRLTAHVLTTMEIHLERFEFESIAVSDDYGVQKSMVMSPAHWRKLVKPRLKKIYGRAKKAGRSVFHHTCGHVAPIIPDLIEIGLDILHPIQPETMDILALKKEFGKDLTFCGGISTQGLLRNGTPDEVRAEVRRLKKVMGKGGGYILESGITIQADIPHPNLFALIDEARKS
jgi:uroporphyrinogen decarboxylase